MADGYVTNWGNDENDGLSWETSKKTFQGAVDAGHSPIYFEGYFNEDFIGNLQILEGAGENSIWDGQFKYRIYLTAISNCVVQNWSDIVYCMNSTNVNFINCSNIIYTANPSHYINNSIVSNCGVFRPLSSLSIKNTIHNSEWRFKGSITLGTDHIISNSDVYNDTGTDLNVSYSLFINSRFQFSGGSEGADETVYTSPTGATDTDKLENLRDRMVIVYGGVAADYLIGCKYYSGSYNDIFVDAENVDFSLVPNCIAAHMSYEGDYVGARKEGIKANWNTDFTNIVNIGTPGLVLNQNLDATAETDTIDLQHVRNVTNIHALGERAARNGQKVNTVSDLGPDLSAGSDVLTLGSVYQCVNDVITLDNSNSYEPWDTFTAVAGGLGFTGTGQVQEVLISDYPEKIQLKASKTDNTLSIAILLTSYLHNSPVMVNVDGGGEPLYGDADPSYNVSTAIPLYTRYLKYYIKIKANNLPAR